MARPVDRVKRVRRASTTPNLSEVAHPSSEKERMRRNTLLALILLLAAIAIAGTLGVLQIYGLGSG
jgi:hypothetical protein